MKFGLRAAAHHPIREIVAFVQQAEAAGFDSAWLPDSP
jgi:alkanesulfonate monooxygenase SsuD/methylene tetrahydromethanopterin reductase-like flavin-dependent oxidoreductase (luciferase family)